MTAHKIKYLICFTVTVLMTAHSCLFFKVFIQTFEDFIKPNMYLHYKVEILARAYLRTFMLILEQCHANVHYISNGINLSEKSK